MTLYKTSLESYNTFEHHSSMKSQFICIQPKTEEAKNVFNSSFKRLHSCKVLQEKQTSKYVKSIAGEYYFWIHENDENWSIVK